MRFHQNIPEIGEKFGKLTIISYNIKQKNKRNIYFVFCECDCGKTIETRYQSVRTHQTQSCGCLAIENCKKLSKMWIKHGMCHKNILYSKWLGMKSRCYQPKHFGNKYYQKKNIIVCEEWKNDFQAFYNWSIQNGYKDNLTLDRKNNNKGYDPNNCRFVNMTIQANNRNNNVLLTAFNETKTLAEWIKDPRCKIKSYQTLYSRVKQLKLTPEEILTIVPKYGNRLSKRT
jgi:hypothetical protein